ncbi:glycosyl hydrolase family 28-related protein [Sphingomonas quercus]|uniref:SMP-30/gluconolactonase/LRE family protein n=1 Tax=Sphingomonas quercus TaxID=2842451 RepID=A0ABS6BGU1_9SPHN|nr:glycosyl hydrolase family 28-related protein [Sphingomonas quercus]MBU3077523.1 SMP-30/gluconolactonase/LRE family protein [Sphingomonas quercus]
MKARLLATAALCSMMAPAAALAAPSALPNVPAEQGAVTVRGVGDGKADDSAALQQAIDAAFANGRGGIVFLPSGRYRISKTIFVRSAVRIFGVGPTRPVILLGNRTPGFDSGVKTMLSFTGEDQYQIGAVAVPPPTSVPFNPRIQDATSSTFYSAMSNVDIEIGAGNPAATGVRFRVAQHGFLRHVDMRIGSGLAGVYQAGNVMEDVHFHGGRYGILTEKTSPAWQFTLIDSTFDGQRDAAIREHEVGLTLVNVRIANTPVGIDIDEGYGDWLWGKDVRFENVARAAVIISNEDNAYTQIGFENALASRTPTFARFRTSGRTVAGAGTAYRMKDFGYGLALSGYGDAGTFRTRAEAEPLKALPAPREAAIRDLPPMSEWTNVKDLGVKGDGKSDDTAAIRQAIASHRVLYFPMGHYVVSDTLAMKPDTVLIGLHPSRTQIVLPDNAPAYAGVGPAKALIEAPSGGTNIVTGLGLFTGGYNPRASNLIWRAGETSLVDDVKIQGGGGTYMADGKHLDMSKPAYRSDGQHPSIWVTDGGGGTFADVWSPNTFASAGFYVSNTKTPGHVYELSNEHHYRNEIVLDGVENWEFLAPQTEQEVRDGVDTVSLEVRNSRNILFANYHAYRVTRTIKPALTAARLFNSSDIRFRNVHVNAESGFATCDANGCTTYLRASKFPFENAILDMTNNLAVRQREFASFDVGATPVAAPAASLAPVEKLADGFYSISGAAVDAAGKLYFVDHRFQRIYGWSDREKLSIVRDLPVDPVNLAIDTSGALMVLSSDGPEATVYSFKPGSHDPITLIKPTPVAAHADARIALPVNTWVNGEFRDQLDPATMRFTTLHDMYVRDAGAAKAREYVSPDGSLALPAYRVLTQGPTNFQGWRWSDSLDSYGFVTARAGERVFVVNGSEDRTYSARVGAAGQLTDLKPFANRGGEGVARGPDGRVYVLNGEVFAYDADGKSLGRILVPERPIQILFGGADGKTLYILTHRTLYAARP